MILCFFLISYIQTKIILVFIHLTNTYWMNTYPALWNVSSMARALITTIALLPLREPGQSGHSNMCWMNDYDRYFTRCWDLSFSHLYSRGRQIHIMSGGTSAMKKNKAEDGLWRRMLFCCGHPHWEKVDSPPKIQLRCWDWWSHTHTKGIWKTLLFP